MVSLVAACRCRPAMIKLPRFQQLPARTRSRQPLSGTECGLPVGVVPRARISLFATSISYLQKRGVQVECGLATSLAASARAGRVLLTALCLPDIRTKSLQPPLAHRLERT